MRALCLSHIIFLDLVARLQRVWGKLRNEVEEEEVVLSWYC